MEDRRSQRSRRLEALRLLTHPLRLRLYYALAAHGSATATMLARDVDTTAQLAFYHLSKLAEGRLIEEDLGVQARGRDRYWRQSSEGLTFAASELGPQAADDIEMLHRTQATVHFERLQDYLASSSAGVDDSGSGKAGDDFRAAAFGSDTVITMTSGQLRALQADIVDLLRRHRQAVKIASSSEATMDVFIFVHGFPLP